MVFLLDRKKIVSHEAQNAFAASSKLLCGWARRTAIAMPFNATSPAEKKGRKKLKLFAYYTQAPYGRSPEKNILNF